MSQTQRQAHYYELAQKFSLDYQGGPPSQPSTITGVYRGRKINLQVQVIPAHLKIESPVSHSRGNYWCPSILLRNFYHTVSVSLTLAVANSYPYVSFSLRTRIRLLRLWEGLKRVVESRAKLDEFQERFVVEINPEGFFTKVFETKICQRVQQLGWKLNLELGAGGLIYEQANDLTTEQANEMLELMSDIADRVEALQNN